MYVGKNKQRSVVWVSLLCTPRQSILLRFRSFIWCYIHTKYGTFEHTHLATTFEQCSFVYTKGGYILGVINGKSKWSVVGIFMLTGSVSDTLVRSNRELRALLEYVEIFCIFFCFLRTFSFFFSFCWKHVLRTWLKTFLNFIFPNIFDTYSVKRILCAYTDRSEWNDIRKDIFVAEKKNS